LSAARKALPASFSALVSPPPLPLLVALGCAVSLAFQSGDSGCFAS